MRMEWDRVPNVRTIKMRAEKTFVGLGKGVIPPLETIIENMEQTPWHTLPNYRFKEWTADLSGLEFVISTVIPELPPHFSFDKASDKEKLERVKCITADVLHDQYGVAAPPGDIYAPDEDLWLMVTSLDTSAPVRPTTLLLCLENLRTVVESEATLTFALTDHFRGKFTVKDWLHLIAMTFCRQARIVIEDTTQHRFSTPISVREAFDSVDNWSNMNTAGKKHPKSIWRDKNAAMAFLTLEPEQQEPRVGKELIYQQKYRPMYSSFITYSDRDLLQAPGTIAIGCPADLISYSAVTRYVLREYGVEKLFRLRPSVTHVRRIQKPLTFAPNNDVVLMFTRPSNKHPMYHESLHLCLAELVEVLQKDHISTIHFPMVDTERPCNNLETWYRTLSDYFEGTGVQIVLHDRVYVSIASIKAQLPPELSDDFDPMEEPSPPPTP